MRQTGHTLDIVYDYSEDFERYQQPIVKLKVDGVELNYLVDTGASTSTIPEGFAKKHSLKKSNYEYDTTLLDGTKKVVQGSVFDVSISDRKFVMEAIHYDPSLGGDVRIDGLIGYDFLKRNKLVINAENHTLCVNSAQTKEQ